MDNRFDRKRVSLKTYIKFALEDKLSYRIIWESLFIERELFINYYKNFAAVYMKQLEHALSKNEIDQSIDLETLAYSLMGIANFVGLQVVFKDEDNNEQVNDEYIDFVTDQVMHLLKHGMFNGIKKRD